ncbi:hypothetical protein B0H63DRAFT_514757 [Podospora didyma]|uniref:Nuclear GTPase SLIP-GC n=1 Tax=Podospora didyma TaxID=330526 RepID=A0AAE0K1R4_9PEZI|nr:hypothetical protein B0H63DRAFT_514757 [Podospora didyma]
MAGQATNPSPEGSIHLHWLLQLPREESFEKLESGVKVGLEILGDLKAALRNGNKFPEIAKLTKDIQSLEKQAVPQRTVVGVVGSTGAGKSSVINAVLDEECIVPTNGMRACTAVITEIQFNNSVDDDEKYQAEIHFISADEWKAELSDLRDEETEAGVSYSKIRSVYPTLTRDDIIRSKNNLEDLIQSFPSVKDVLGTVKKISTRSDQEFAASLQQYVDSKEKTGHRKKDKTQWIDLPSVQDSNAARSAIASKYIEQCTGLWIIPPIQRAVDGTYGSVTFICSKTDIISPTETLQRMSPEDHGPQLCERQQALKDQKEKLQEEVNPINAEINELAGKIKELDREIDAIENALAVAEDEEDLFIVSPIRPRKRKCVEENPTRKRSLYHESSEGEEDYSDSDLEAGDTSQVSKNDASQRLETIKAEKKALRMKSDIKSLQHETKKWCIKSRNNRTRPAIQQHFAEGIRELDQDIAAQQDEDNFDPDEELRDYAKAHGRQIVKYTRRGACRKFLNDVCKLLTSLSIRVLAAEEALKLADDIRDRELKHLSESIKVLRKKTDVRIERAFTECREAVKSMLFPKLSSAAKYASKTATATVNKWGVSREEGGLAFHSYFAVCRRNGVFQNVRKQRWNWNEELAASLVSELARRWEHTFDKRLPERVESLARRLAKPHEAFATQMNERQHLRKSLSFNLVAQQKAIVQTTIKDTTSLKAHMKEGRNQRAKEIMQNHVKDMRERIFKKATSKTEDCINQILCDLRSGFENHINHVID